MGHDIINDVTSCYIINFVKRQLDTNTMPLLSLNNSVSLLHAWNQYSYIMDYISFKTF